MKNLILALTFVPSNKSIGVTDTYDLISANVGKRINNQFVLTKSFKLVKAFLNTDFHKEQIYQFQNYLNSRWHNKGMLLLDIRSDTNNYSKSLCKLLVNVHKEFGNNISEIICGIASRQEFELYLEHIKATKKYKQELDKKEEENQLLYFD